VYLLNYVQEEESNNWYLVFSNALLITYEDPANLTTFDQIVNRSLDSHNPIPCELDWQRTISWRISGSYRLQSCQWKDLRLHSQQNVVSSLVCSVVHGSLNSPIWLPRWKRPMQWEQMGCLPCNSICGPLSIKWRAKLSQRTSAQEEKDLIGAIEVVPPRLPEWWDFS